MQLLAQQDAIVCEQPSFLWLRNIRLKNIQIILIASGKIYLYMFTFAFIDILNKC